MSILNKLNKLNKVEAGKVGKTPMTPEQIKQYKERIRAKGLGYNVHPNQFDIATPLKVAINYGGEWHNYGAFSSPDVAGAVGSIISLYYFGDKAKAGNFDSGVAESHEEYKAWINDDRNKFIIEAVEAGSCVHQNTVEPTTAPAENIAF